MEMARLAAAGRRLCVEAGEDFAPQAAAWRLTEAAARAFAAMPDREAGWMRGGGSAWPEITRTKAEIFGTERERLTDGVEIETMARRVLSSEEVDCAWSMWDLWREAALPAHKERKALIKAVWLYALGLPPRRIHEGMGVNRLRLWRARENGVILLSHKIFCQTA